MTPADRILIDGDTGWLIVGPLGPGADVIPGDQAITEWRARFDRPCETCDGTGMCFHGGPDVLPRCPDCIDGRHTFDLEVDRWAVGRRHGPKTITYRVAIIEILPIIHSDTWQSNDDITLPCIVVWADQARLRTFEGHSIGLTLPSAAAPGMFAVKLAVRA